MTPGRSIHERAQTQPALDLQDGLFDRVIENDVLEQALENREAKRQIASAAGADFKDANETAQSHIAGLDLQVDEVVRCGRFRIKKSRKKATSVAFETQETTQLRITALG